MTETLPRGPITPVTGVIPAISWFEFVLNEKQLEDHLSKENPDPSPTQLIVQFIQQAESQHATDTHPREVPNAREVPNGVEIKQEDTEPKLPALESRKVKALRLLALKVAAHLRWNLEVMIKSIPTAVMQAVLSELLRISLDSEYEGVKTSLIDFSTLPEEARFAVHLYHRWCVLTVVRDSFPTKSVRSFVQSPGQFDPLSTMGWSNDALMNYLKEKVSVSEENLQKCIQCGLDVNMPTMSSIATTPSNIESPALCVDRGTIVPAQELVCQLSYDLGTFNFFKQTYNSALILFQKSKDLYEQMSSPVYCHIDETRLSGYLTACSSLKVVPDTKKVYLRSLYDRAESARRNDYQGIVEILIEDNLKQELSAMYRSDLEDEIAAKEEGYTNLFIQVSICNVIRGVMEGKALVSVLADVLEEADRDTNSFLIKVLSRALDGASYAQKTNLKCFIWHLIELAPQATNFIQLVMGSEIKKHFNESECRDMQMLDEEGDVKMSDMFDDASATTTACTSYPSTRDSSVNMSNLEHQLMYSYDTDIVRHLITDLFRKQRRSPTYIMSLNDKWRVPRDIHHVLMSLPPTPDQAYVYVLVGKACHCMDVKIYERAKNLLMVADGVVSEMSYTLSKHVRWQVLLADLLQYNMNETVSENSSLQELIKKTKTCITSVRIGTDILPSHEVLEHCAAFLLNVRDWSYLANMENTAIGHIELCRLLACLCRELHNLKNARKVARDVWEAVVQMFTTNTQHKRTSSGRDSAFRRDSQFGILSKEAFVQFLKKLKEPTVLTALVSLITKFYNCLKDDINCEISNDYIALWPSNFGNSSSNAINTPAVEESVVMFMQHVLQVNPAQPSWLRTQADIHFAHGQYSTAMKYYLEAGVVASEFFTSAVPKSIFDDQVYRRMIKCCSYLQCHTQLAVLCQFLDEVDYTAAFKALQERNCYDAMDSYYACVWDISILEYLVHLHTRRGEMDKRQSAMRALSQLDLNSNNPEDIIQRAVQMRKRKFLRALAKQYL